MTTFSNPFNVFPGAGGNWQEIMTRWWSPNISLNFAGDAGIEREVNEDVASYGRHDYRRLLRSLDPEQPPGAD
jgi:hypothetical protein